MKILITGHRGFVGRHLWYAYAKQGHQLNGIDLGGCDFITPQQHAGPRSIAGSDCLDYFRTADTHYDLAIHCAAVIGGRAGIDGSPLAVATNLALDAWFFRWLQRSGTPRAVYYSSSAAYPTVLQDGEYHDRYAGSVRDRVRRLTLDNRLSESDIDLHVVQRPDQTYGLAKLTGEQLAQHARDAGTQVTVLRPFSGYGTDQDRAYPFPSFIARALRKDDPFLVWGDGEQVRDWIHIDDIVGATLAAVEQDVAGPLNLCTGRATSFNQLAKLVTQAAGYGPAIEHRLDAPTGVHYRVGDPTKLHQVYTPRVSLEEGIARALKDLGSA